MRVALSLFAVGNSGGKWRFGKGGAELHRVRLVAASMQMHRGHSVPQMTAFRARMDENGKAVLDPATGFLRFEESFRPVWYVDTAEKGGPSRKCRTNEEAREQQLALKEAGWSPTAPKEREISDALCVYAFGNPNQFQDRQAGDVLGAMFSRLPRNEELPILDLPEAGKWLSSHFAPTGVGVEAVAESLPHSIRISGQEFQIRTEGNPVRALSDGSIVVEQDGNTSLIPKPKGWEPVSSIKEGVGEPGLIFLPRSPEARRAATKAAHKKDGFSGLQVERFCFGCETKQLAAPADVCPACGGVLDIPAVEVKGQLSKETVFVDLNPEEEDLGRFPALGMQSPAKVSHWLKCQEQHDNSLSTQCAALNGKKRLQTMEKAGGRNKISALTQILSV